MPNTCAKDSGESHCMAKWAVPTHDIISTSLTNALPLSAAITALYTQRRPRNTCFFFYIMQHGHICIVVRLYCIPAWICNISMIHMQEVSKENTHTTVIICIHEISLSYVGHVSDTFQFLISLHYFVGVP